MSSSLMAFKSQLVSRDYLTALPPPVSLGPKHVPIKHVDLVRAIDDEIARRGYREAHSRLAVSKNGQKLFGVIDLIPPGAADADLVPSLGFRAANDQTLALRMVAGARVTVCDNLALMGDMIALNRMHTSSLNLPEAMAAGFDRFLHHSTILVEHIDRMSTTFITDAQARAIAFHVFAERVVPLHLLNDVNGNYFHPKDDARDCQARTLWSLHNAFTRAMRTLSATRLFGATMHLATHFGMVSQAE